MYNNITALVSTQLSPSVIQVQQYSSQYDRVSVEFDRYTEDGQDLSEMIAYLYFGDTSKPSISGQKDYEGYSYLFLSVSDSDDTKVVVTWVLQDSQTSTVGAYTFQIAIRTYDGQLCAISSVGTLVVVNSKSIANTYYAVEESTELVEGDFEELEALYNVVATVLGQSGLSNLYDEDAIAELEEAAAEAENLIENQVGVAQVTIDASYDRLANALVVLYCSAKATVDDNTDYSIVRMEAEDYFTNGIYGLYVAWTAARYHLARYIGEEVWEYKNTNLFTATLGDSSSGSIDGGDGSEGDDDDVDDDTGDDTGVDDTNEEVSNTDGVYYILRSKDGTARLDCSAFAGLVLRGVTYENSPFVKYPASLADGENYVTWTPSEDMVYGNSWYKTDIYDKMQEGLFTTLGFDGHSSLRTAAQFAEYFYRTGLVLFDSEVDGDSANYGTSFWSDFDLQPGDLIFWAKSSASNTQKARFRSISHIAIVEERPKWYMQVTTGSRVVSRGNLGSSSTNSSGKHTYDEIAFAIRPDYRFNRTDNEEELYAPIGVNLLHYPWNFGAPAGNAKVMSNGLVRSMVAPNDAGDDGIRIYGEKFESHQGVSFTSWLKGNATDNAGLPYLIPGTYKLSGMDGTGITTTSFTIQVRHEDNTDFDTAIRAYDGHDAEFTIEQAERVRVSLYIGTSSVTNEMDVTIYPRLERLS